MPASPAPRPWLALALLALATAGFAAIWVLLAAYRDHQSSWMAVLAGLDAALVLRLGQMRSGGKRALLAVAATAIVILLANWGIAATQIGNMLGLLPWESLLRMGNAYAWSLIQLANGTGDVAWWGLGLLVAAVASR